MKTNYAIEAFFSVFFPLENEDIEYSFNVIYVQ